MYMLISIVISKKFNKNRYRSIFDAHAYFYRNQQKILIKIDFTHFFHVHAYFGCLEHKSFIRGKIRPFLMYMRIFNTSSRLGQYHSLTQVLTQYQYQFQYQKCSIPIPKISSIEFPGSNLPPPACQPL